MPSLRMKRNNSIGLMGGGRLASCAIVILLMHAILVHIYILHLSDTIVMLHNSGSGGRGNRDRKEKLSPFLKQRPQEDNKRHDDTNRTAAVNIHDENNNASITLVVYSGPNTKDYKMAKLYKKNCDDNHCLVPIAKTFIILHRII